MRKFRFFLMTAALFTIGITGCKQPEEVQPGGEAEGIGKFTVSDIVDAAASAYTAWENGEEFPTSFEIGGKSLTTPQYQYAICKALVNLVSGVKDDIDVLSYKPAEHPERDSYDKENIAVSNGPKNGEETEDLVNVATRMMARMASDLKVPNQTNFTRNGAAIAFSTNRATLVISRALAAYKADGKFPAEINADHKGASATLKAFAQQLVTYLDVWEKTIGTVDADGSHSSFNGDKVHPWENVHFIPIEYSGGYKGDMYSEKYMPYHHIVVDNREYTAAECWNVAAKGIMDIVTKEGSSMLQPSRNPFVHTLGGGKSLNEPIPTVDEYATVTGFNSYPWYENTGDDNLMNFSDKLPCNIDFLAHLLGWYLTRCTLFDTPAIGNFQQFGTGDGTINFFVGDLHYDGIISAMRTFLIMIRYYKILLDNNITENIYEATKDMTIDYDLYGVEMPDIELKTSSVSFAAKGETKEVSFMAKKAWTATPSESWITVEPASGTEGDITLKVTVAGHEGAERTGKIIVKGGNVDAAEITVTQAAYIKPSDLSLKDFAQEFVKGLDVWATTIGNVDADGVRNQKSKDGAWVNVHFIPTVPNPNCEYLNYGDNQYDPKYTPWVLHVGDAEYSSNQAWEIAIRGLLNMVTAEGEAQLDAMDSRNKPFTLTDAGSFTGTKISSPSPDNKWGKHPWYEGGNLVKNGGQEVKDVDIAFMVKVGAWHIVRGLIYNATSNPNPLGMIGNFQEFGTDINGTLVLENYVGYISPMRELLVLMRIYKYLLDNNVDTNVYSALKNQRFDFDLYGESLSKPVTIKDFATEYVKLLDIWQNTTGTLNRLSNCEPAGPDDKD
ncbi:MAG: BACON domain-containing protein, partial [Bacteroidales bacterium]|nr:BACON domain-containing protein [Bacteroidales bacterium]